MKDSQGAVILTALRMISAYSPVEQFKMLELGAVPTGGITEGFGELVVQRSMPQGENGFIITLTKDGEGIWRINGM